MTILMYLLIFFSLVLSARYEKYTSFNTKTYKYNTCF